MGGVDQTTVPPGKSPLFLQTMGGRAKGSHGKGIEWANVQRDAEGPCVTAGPALPSLTCPRERPGPIGQQIAATDKKIDELVYKLYGLTEEEIRIVEG